MALFDAIADSYDEWYLKPFGQFIDEVESELAFSIFKVEKGMKILDLGCGTGNYTLRLAEEGAEVTGADLSEKMLQQAKQKAAKRHQKIDFIPMDMNHLKLKEEEYDAIFSMTAVEFVEDLEDFLTACLKGVKPGGKVLLGTITASGTFGKAYQARKNSIYEAAKFRDLEDLQKVYALYIIGSSEGLYLELGDKEASDYRKRDEERKKVNSASFACALWQKPITKEN